MGAVSTNVSSGSGLRTAVVLAAAGSAGAGLIHAAAAGSHEGARSLVWMFAACAALQLGWAAIAVLVPNRPVMVAGAGINGAAVVTWFLSRTVGISAVDALTEPEALGFQDTLAAILAAVAVGAAVVVITQPYSLRALPNAWSAAIVFATVALVVPALAAGHTHGHDHLADEHVHTVGEAAAHSHGDNAGDGHEHDDVEVAGAVAHNDDDGHHSTTGGTTTNSDDHDDHHATLTGTNTGGTSNGDHHHSDGTPPPAGSPTTPSGHGHGHQDPPVNPPPGTPPHTHPPATPTGPIVTVNDPRLSAAQQQAAGSLLLNTVKAMTAYPTVAAVQAAGYQSIGDASTGFEHFVNWNYFFDTIELDPSRIESIVAKVNPDGSRTVVSGMYILAFGKTMADVPDIAGELTTWHDHQDLCWTSTPTGGQRVTGIAVNGKCPNGGVNVATPPMLHVWLAPQPCGPFTGIEGTHGSACQHSH